MANSPAPDDGHQRLELIHRLWRELQAARTDPTKYKALAEYLRKEADVFVRTVPRQYSDGRANPRLSVASETPDVSQRAIRKRLPSVTWYCFVDVALAVIAQLALQVEGLARCPSTRADGAQSGWLHSHPLAQR